MSAYRRLPMRTPERSVAGSGASCRRWLILLVKSAMTPMDWIPAVRDQPVDTRGGAGAYCLRDYHDI